jgi:hypothetical protein
MGAIENRTASWLTNLVLGAAATMSEIRTSAQGFITNQVNGNRYQVLQKLAVASHFNLYQCILNSGQLGVIKVAASQSDNQALDREALMLKTMYDEAHKIETEKKSGQLYNYHLFFPELIESFISESQNNRRINILGFPDVIKDVGQLTSVSNIIEKDQEYVDPKTGAWFLGKTLKVAGFSHMLGISNSLYSGGNILLECDKHGVIVFDWTQAIMYPDGIVPEYVRKQEVSQIACLAIDLMAGDQKTGFLPESDQLTNDKFEQMVYQLALGKIDDAAVAHDQFYELIWDLWGHKFHPYTSFARK